MCSTSLRHPDQIFSKIPARPPPWPKLTSPSVSPTLTTSSSILWKEDGTNKPLVGALSHLQRNLRFVHKRKIVWPAEESISSNLSPREYLTALLKPIADIYNQLHSPKVLKTPMEYIHIDFGESIWGATFTAEEFKIRRVTAPIVLCLPDDLFDSKGKVSSRIEYALSKALEFKPSAPSIIITNFKDIAVFFLSTWFRSEPVLEKISTTQPSLALRVISAACLNEALRFGPYINVPSPDVEVDIPEGPPQDPNQPLLADERVFATHRLHSDFDIVTLVRDRARALQFFRWHEHVQQQYSKLVAHPNDMITAVTNEVGMILPDIHPIYPFDASEIPTDTAAHLKTIQRESPLVTIGISEAFERSKSFTLKILSVLSEGSERSISTVYRCQITSIDGHHVSSPSLCLKLFDDRFQSLQSPKEDERELDELLPRWFEPVVIAEMYALNEAFAYDKLRPTQGTVVPWFYGMHQFTLPDGTALYGLLMEYIEGRALDSDFAQELSPSRQIKMARLSLSLREQLTKRNLLQIQSCHHAARVLDVADVSQRDWHNGQILLHTSEITKADHVILIDFASTTQTWDSDEPNLIENYFGILRVLLTNVGFNLDLVWKYYGEPDDWDTTSYYYTHPGSKEERHFRARDMFPYISCA